MLQPDHELALMIQTADRAIDMALVGRPEAGHRELRSGLDRAERALREAEAGAAAHVKIWTQAIGSFTRVYGPESDHRS